MKGWRVFLRTDGGVCMCESIGISKLKGRMMSLLCDGKNATVAVYENFARAKKKNKKKKTQIF